MYRHGPRYIVASACIPAAAGCVLFERTHHPVDPLYGCHSNICQRNAILESVFNYQIYQNLAPNYIIIIFPINGISKFEI